MPTPPGRDPLRHKGILTVVGVTARSALTVDLRAGGDGWRPRRWIDVWWSSDRWIRSRSDWSS